MQQQYWQACCLPSINGFVAPEVWVELDVMELEAVTPPYTFHPPLLLNMAGWLCERIIVIGNLHWCMVPPATDR
jgi:hypothetical protein